jgi:nucleoside-diphosphate-sugar epimerase
VLNLGPNVIVVTGAGGFLGSRVLPMVRRQAGRARVVAVVRHRRRRARFAPGVEVIHGDLRQPAVWRRVPLSVTHVIHLAAAIPWDRREAQRPRVVLDNVAPIAHLLQASARWPDLRHVVYASSVSIYAPSRTRLHESSATGPASLYAAAKLAGEQLLGPLTARGVGVAALRYSSIYGAGQYPGTVLPLLANRARRGLPLHVFNGRRTQDFVHVDDAARATWLACRRAARGAYNVGSGRPISMSILAREILAAFDRSGTSRIVIEAARELSGPSGIRMNIGRARRVLGFRPRIDLRDGLSQLAREADA